MVSMGFSWSFCCLGAPPSHAISLTGRRHADHPYPHPLPLSESERAAAADYERAVAAERAAADERERTS